MPLSNLQFFVEELVIRFRLEDYLFDKFPTLSRMYIRDVIRLEKCQVNGRIENKGKRVSSGDFIEIELDLERENAMRGEAIPLDIIYEDHDLIAVKKPAGMLVHPTHREKNGTLLNALNFYLNRHTEEKVVRPGLVHRLDKETSGLVLIAKNPAAHRTLARQFQRKSVTKVYFALTEGIPEKSEGSIDLPIGRFAEEKRWDVHPDGGQALTHYRVIEAYSDSSLLELRPVTGRTNQLRIHCASLGHPIVGDVSRGGRNFGNLCLHAHSLEFRHPRDGHRMILRAGVPAWLQTDRTGLYEG